MKNLLLVLIIGLFVKLSRQDKLQGWKVNSNEWMLLEEDKSRPVLFDKCPIGVIKCQWCYAFKDYEVNATFQSMFDNKPNADKFYCYYKVTDENDLYRIKHSVEFDEIYDQANHLLFTWKDICDSICVQTLGKQCGKIRRGNIFGIIPNHKYYCPKVLKKK